MQENHIAEVRGKLPHQNLEPIMQGTLEEKLKEFGPEALSYQKKSEDMRLLTKIEEKSQKSEPLTKEELTFIYEIDSKIESFGYGRDPRIEEIRSQRKTKEDLPILFDCAPEDIATRKEDIRETTKAYVGKLFPNIFKAKIEHIYTAFPEGKIQNYQIEIGGKTKNDYERELKEKKISVTSYAQNLLDSPDFNTLKSKENADLVRLTVGDLGFPNGATTDEVYSKAKDFGLELCPPEVGPQLRLSYAGEDWMLIGMKQIEDRDRNPNVFNLYHYGAVLQLDADYARLDGRWGAAHPFVFRLRKDA